MKDLKEKLVSEYTDLANNSASDSIAKIRENAIGVFNSKGFPTTKDEDWKYTSLREVLAQDFKFSVQAKGIDKDSIKKFVVDVDSYNLVFVNGVFNSELSSNLQDEADICVLSKALQDEKYRTIIEKRYNKIAKEDSVVALNTAYSNEGAFVYVPRNVVLTKPIQILYFSNGDEVQMANPRNLVVLETNAQVHIIERHQTLNGKANFTNSVTEVYVDKNAHLDYYKIQNDDLSASLVDSTFVEQERDSVAKFQTHSIGGKLTRNGLNFIQRGENCNSVMNGITLGSGEQLIDHHTFIEHMAPNCESHELYRTILDDSAKGVFNGKVLVDADAQKIDAFQQNNNVLLSSLANAYSKPQLEIFADDVKCSHGCTIGQLDHDAMFYLKSRGIPPKAAKALLLYAFMADVTNAIEIPELKTRVTNVISEKLGVKLDF